HRYRSLSVQKSYIAFYRIEQNHIIIIRILKTSQDYISLLELE
ncbi:MAG: type II toxin-antitoxin system RelE/ParE family toxin, partial [Anaeroplasmataceae bacterium]|nr:type II toxin-antitoxin system RelE/ParE family toxin [Anaeroplasmataceae bacterium]